jgi:uncharacterized protein
MLVPVLVSLGLLAWSVIANLVIGEHLYVTRNLLLCVVLIAVAFASGSGWRELGLGRDTFGSGLRWGLGGVGVVVVVVAIGILLRDAIPLIDTLLGDRRADLDDGQLAWAAFVRIPVGTALFEEIAFRGVLLASLLQVTSTPWAVTWSSLAFGLWHVAPTIVTLRINAVSPTSTEGIGAIVGAVALTTVAGVLFALLRLVAGSLLAPTLVHWATNSVGLVTAALLGDNADDPSASPRDT